MMNKQLQNNLKKWIMMLLTVSMILSSVMPAFAAERDSRDEDTDMTAIKGNSSAEAARRSSGGESLATSIEKMQSLTTRDGEFPRAAGNDMVIVSPEMYSILAEWQDGALPENQSLETFLVENSPETISRWAAAAERRTRTSLATFAKENNVAVAATKRDTGSLAVAMAAAQPEYLYTWQVTALAEDSRLQQYVQSNEGKIYAKWDSSRYIPADTDCLLDYVAKAHPKMVRNATQYYQLMTGKKECPPSWPPPPPPPGDDKCECKHVITFPADPSGFSSATDPTVEDDDDKKKDQWWTEQWKAAHYGELYAHVKKEGQLTSFDIAQLKNENMAGIRYRLACYDENYKECGQCNARLNQYAHYGSKIQVHVDGKGSLFKKLQAKGASGDSAKMTTTLGNGQVVGFEKAGAITMDAKAEFDGTKVVNVIKGIIGLATEVIKVVAGGAPDPAKITKWTTETVKNLFGIVKYEGTKGTKSHEVKVTFDSLSNAVDPEHIIESNIDYTLKIETAAHITFEGKGKWAKTDNSYYGSGFAAAIAINRIDCDDEVTKQPNPVGAWSYANTFRSPYSNTNSFKHNVEEFIKQALGVGFGPNASSSEGYWEIP